MKRPLLLAAACLALACRASSEAPAPSPSPHGGAAPASATPSESAEVALDRLDTRTPVPLLPVMALHQKENMRDHLVAVQQIVEGLGAEDFDRVLRAAERLGSSPEMARMCSHFGAQAPGFTEQALAFHRTADEILHAARARDQASVLAALAKTLSGCTGCHASFKQRVVAELGDHALK